MAERKPLISFRVDPMDAFKRAQERRARILAGISVPRSRAVQWTAADARELGRAADQAELDLIVANARADSRLLAALLTSKTAPSSIDKWVERGTENL